MYHQHPPHLSVIIALSVVFGSGLMIWGYNKLQGVDLSRSPEIDYSQFELQVKPPSYLVDTAAAASSSYQVAEAIKQIYPQEVKQQLDSKLLKHSLYFTKFFRGQTVAQTQVQINNFLNDFPTLKNFPLTDVTTFKCVEATLPVANRDALIVALMTKPEIEKVIAPTETQQNFEICFRAAQYLNEAKKFFDTMPEVKVVSEEQDMDYVAYVTYGSDNAAVKPDLEKIAKYYSDIVKVSE